VYFDNDKSERGYQARWVNLGFVLELIVTDELAGSAAASGEWEGFCRAVRQSDISLLAQSGDGGDQEHHADEGVDITNVMCSSLS
jgi:hypothetical protein